MRQVFKKVCGWDVIGWVIALFACLGIAAMYGKDYAVAIRFYSLSAVIFVVRWVTWRELRSHSRWRQWSLTMLGIGVAGSCLTWSIAHTLHIKTIEEFGSSRLEVTNVVGIPTANKGTGRAGFFLNVFYANKGSIATSMMSHRSMVVFADHLLTETEEQPYKDESRKGPLPSVQNDEIQPGPPP